MNLVPNKILIPNPSSSEAAVEQIIAIAWSPNNQKLAVAGKDRVIYLYDEDGEQRDRFPTKPADSKKGSIYTVSSISFSPDSTKLAVAQTDGIIYLYKIGNEFKQKKSIGNKVMQPFGVMQVLWPNEFELICGLMDGKLRHTPLANAKTLRSRTFYNPDSQIVAMTSDTKEAFIASAHLDGKIAVFGLGEADVPSMKYVVQNNLPAFALTFGGSMLLAGTCDSRITVYEQGKQKQILDFSHVELDKDFVSAAGSPSGLATAFGGYDRIRLLRWVPRKKLWEEGPIMHMKNLYTVTSLAWNLEGTSLAAGSMTGGLHLFETVMRKSRTDKYEISYATPFHAVVTITNPPQKAHLKSMYKLEILEIRILGQDRFAIASTMETLLICDIYKNQTSEIRWEGVDDTEKFYFDNPNACMIFHNGEMTLIEYGQHKPLGNFRTEFANPHLISLRINERIQVREEDGKQNKKLAYLMDLQTITIVDLVYNSTLGHISHDSKIDWLELNETGRKLLFRDRRLRLYLADVEKIDKTCIMHMCSFVQWVPSSDVIVAQNKVSLCVWYDVDSPGEIVELEARGLAFEVVRSPKETFVLVQDGTIIHQVPLDSNRIEFGTAILDGDYLRAMIYLEVSPMDGKKESMWKQLAREAIEAKELKIAERACYAAGDISRGKFISTTIRHAENSYARNGNEDAIVNELQARLSVLNGDLQTAEYVILETENIESAIHMYTANHKWNEAIRLATEKHYNNITGLVRAHLLHLIESHQDEAAAEFLEENGNIGMAAILYWTNGMPMKAARLIESNHNKMDLDPNFVQRVGITLEEQNLFAEAAEYYDAVGDMDSACSNYKKSDQYEQALRIAKKHFPGTVVILEEEWGNYLRDKKLYDLACHHFVEAGKLRQALDAAIQGRHWAKAAQIVEVIDDPRSVALEYIRIGDYYASVDDYINAEKCFLRASNPKKAVEMYMSKGKWQEAYAIGSSIPAMKEELESELFILATINLKNGKFSESEKLYIALGKPDTAISMYGEARLFEDMLRLVSQFHPAHLNGSYVHVADTLREEDNCKGAEIYYLKAGQFQPVLEMYVERGLFEDAVRISKMYGPPDAYKVVIYKWAVTLNPDLGYKLLFRHELLDDCLLYYCEQKNFEFALALAEVMGRDKVTGVLYERARHFEESGDIESAIKCYREAEDPVGAVRLFVKHQLFDDALRLAEEICPNELDTVHVTYGEYLFQVGSYTESETMLLRAERADILIQQYQDRKMWGDAFRVCKQYAPNLLPEVQEYYENAEAEKTSNFSSRDSVKIINKAQEYERYGQNDKAIEFYLRLNPTNTKDETVLMTYWKRAAELAIKFFNEKQIQAIVGRISQFMTNIGRYREAAQICFEANLVREGLEILMTGNLFEEAEEIAIDMGPDVQDYVRGRHTAVLRESGSVDQLSAVNLDAALEVLMEQGNWSQLLEKAKANPNSFSIYMGKYAMHSISEKNVLTAVKLYHTHGVPTQHSHISIIQSLTLAYLGEPMLDEYENNVMLRDTLWKYYKQLEEESGDVERHQIDELEQLLFIIHLYTNRSVFRNASGFEVICTKISISFLRYGDILPIERAFFDAGIYCKDIQWNDMSLVFLNRYLDIFDAVEEGRSSTSALDSSAFMETDIPAFCTLPSEHTVSQEEHEEAKEWVLSAATDKIIVEELRRDSRGEYEASLSRGSDDNPIYQACIISGYPVIGAGIAFDSGRQANRDDWKKFVTALKSSANPELVGIFKFINQWCGNNSVFGL